CAVFLPADVLECRSRATECGRLGGPHLHRATDGKRFARGGASIRGTLGRGPGLRAAGLSSFARGPWENAMPAEPSADHELVLLRLSRLSRAARVRARLDGRRPCPGGLGLPRAARSRRSRAELSDYSDDALRVLDARVRRVAAQRRGRWHARDLRLPAWARP